MDLSGRLSCIFYDNCWLLLKQLCSPIGFFKCKTDHHCCRRHLQSLKKKSSTLKLCTIKEEEDDDLILECIFFYNILLVNGFANK